MSIAPSWLQASHVGSQYQTLAADGFKAEEAMGGVRPVLEGSVDEMRAQFAGLEESLAALYPPPSDAVLTQDGTREGIKYRVYTPRRQGDMAPEGQLPVGVFFHGGGFVLGDLDTEDGLCRAIAENVNAVLVSIDYRLAPANKAPSQLQDAIKMFEWAYHNAPTLGGDPRRLFTIGTSAGGALALAVARKVRLRHTALSQDAIKCVVAFNPVVFHTGNVPEQYSSQHTAFNENKENTPIIDLETLTSFYNLCNLKTDDADYFVGLDQASHQLFPPSYIVTCGLDPLRDDGKVLAESLESRGVPVRRDHYDGLPHCFWVVPTLPESAEFLKNAIQGVTWVMDKM
ncbi:hypothetical protein NW761_014881 [Fusarium oxysporum]|nr:hypothetical protein NW758_010334 [Fusarium oxysporum]KAJ4072479.1 hypothetical protein NW761_014881 [Fusarium oxysporum]